MRSRRSPCVSQKAAIPPPRIYLGYPSLEAVPDAWLSNSAGPFVPKTVVLFSALLNAGLNPPGGQMPACYRCSQPTKRHDIATVFPVTRFGRLSRLALGPSDRGRAALRPGARGHPTPPSAPGDLGTRKLPGSTCWRCSAPWRAWMETCSGS